MDDERWKNLIIFNMWMTDAEMDDFFKSGGGWILLGLVALLLVILFLIR